jgi:DNA-binding SARP family transcriptional activator
MALHLALLDGFELRYAGHPVQVALSCQRLLVYLALHQRPLLRIHVAGALWPSTTDNRAAASLRSAVWRLRQLRLPLVQATASHLVLSDEVVVDVREYEARIKRLLTGVLPDPAALEEAWPSGELLPDWYDDWVIVERERLRQIGLHVLEAVCQRLVDEGRFAQAINAGLAAVAAEPLRESAHRVLVRAYLAEGNPCEALRQYDTYQQLLGECLGLQPSGSLEDLVRPLRRGCRDGTAPGLRRWPKVQTGVGL